MVWGVYKEGITDGAVKEEKVVVFGEGSGESYYMYTQPVNVNEGYRLYRSAVTDGKSWTELSVSGLPAGEVRLSQITAYEDAFYAVTTKGFLYSSADGQTWSLVENAPVIKPFWVLLMWTMILRQPASSRQPLARLSTRMARWFTGI